MRYDNNLSSFAISMDIYLKLNEYLYIQQISLGHSVLTRNVECYYPTPAIAAIMILIIVIICIKKNDKILSIYMAKLYYVLYVAGGLSFGYGM